MASSYVGVNELLPRAKRRLVVSFPVGPPHERPDLLFFDLRAEVGIADWTG